MNRAPLGAESMQIGQIFDDKASFLFVDKPIKLFIGQFFIIIFRPLTRNKIGM